MTDCDIPLLRKTLAHAVANPRQVNFHVWVDRNRHGTVACLAGWAGILSGHTFDDDGYSTCRCRGHKRGEQADTIAERELRLSPAAADDLFFCRKMRQVWPVVRVITNGEIRGPEDL